MANLQRQVGKQIATGTKETRTPSQIVSGSFSVPTPANDNSPRSSRSSLDIQNAAKTPANISVSDSTGSSSDARGRKIDIDIVGLSPSTPEQVKAREDSLKTETPPTPELDKETAKTLGPNIAKAVAGGPSDKNPYTEDTTSFTYGDTFSGNEDIPDEKISDESFADLNINIPTMNMNREKFFKLKSNLSAAGYNLTNAEVANLLSCNFKVAFPWAVIFANLSKGLNDITMTIIGLFFTVIGTGATTLGTFVLPVIGTIAGGSITAIGLGIGLIGFSIGFVIVLISLYLKFRYLSNASDALYKVGFLRRQMYRYSTRRIWRWFFGANLPLLGWVLNSIETILSWRHITRIVKKLERMVKAV